MITFSSSIKLLKEPGGYYFEAKLQQALAARAEQIRIYDGTYSILKQHATTLFELWQKAILALDRAETLTSQTNATYCKEGCSSKFLEEHESETRFIKPQRRYLMAWG